MKEQFIYVIKEDETENIKVGISCSPNGRLMTLQTGNPRKLTLIHKFEGTHRTEADIHEKLKEFNIKGEWFKPPKGFLDSLNDLEEVERQHMKMVSFRLNPKLMMNFKKFCTKNNITIKQSLTKVIEVLLEAERSEINDRTEDLLDVQKA